MKSKIKTTKFWRRLLLCLVLIGTIFRVSTGAKVLSVLGIICIIFAIAICSLIIIDTVKLFTKKQGK
jgi:tellurite resistance protein TehA-like permease